MSNLRNTLICANLTLVTSVALAGEHNTWTGAVSNDWSNPANWSQNVVPGPLGEYKVRIDSGSPVVNSNLEPSRTGTTGDFVMTGGDLTIGGSFRHGVLAPDEVHAVGTATQSGGAITTDGVWSIGVRGTATYHISGGSMTVGDGFNLSVANLEGSRGTLIQTGGTIVVGGASAYIGQNGVGDVYISGGTFLSNNMNIGEGSLGHGHVYFSGGTIDLTQNVGSTPGRIGWLYVGKAGNHCNFDISGDSVLRGITLVFNRRFRMIGSNPQITFSDRLILGSTDGGLTIGGDSSRLEFIFDADGVAPMTFGGLGWINPNATVLVDGSGYQGGMNVFTLIDAASFTSTPNIVITGFEQPTLPVWNQVTGDFTLAVIPEPASAAALVLGGLILMPRCRRR